MRPRAVTLIGAHTAGARNALGGAFSFALSATILLRDGPTRHEGCDRVVTGWWRSRHEAPALFADAQLGAESADLDCLVDLSAHGYYAAFCRHARAARDRWR